MAFDSQTRNKLARLVTDARQLLTDEFTKQLQEIFGIQPDGIIIRLEKLVHLTDEQASVASVLRDRVDHLAAGLTSEKKPVIAAIDRMTREQSFTILNRFAALRMAEERGIVQECVRGRMQSKGFQVYLKIAGGGLGDQYERYKAFLFCIFDEVAVDLGILFDRYSPFGLLFPREQALQALLDIINDPDLKTIWTEDETIGWVYQYFNPPEERRAMREASAAPRNSRELAVRNQFFTPRYVVEFLTDNTLGRIWYEMRKGNTRLSEECRYLVRRPNEVFLGPGEKAPEHTESDENLTQEELIRKPVYIEHRVKKDPRDIRVLDPACGSGHFLLYAFILLLIIYEEAWGDPENSKSESTGKSLQEDYCSLDDLRRDAPKLIIEHNLHGIDIDPRCTQIAAVALWLRAQKSWMDLGLRAAERPKISRSNIVTAEPMPGEEDMLREFTDSIRPRVLGQVVDVVFEKMKLAGEAGSLLKIEEKIKDAVAEAKRQWLEGPKPEQAVLFPELIKVKPEQQQFRFDLRGVTDEQFWEQAEDRILDALKDYAERAENGYGMRRRLFAEDAARGFAFIDLFRKSYDVVLMNPPFGEPSESTKSYLDSTYEVLSGNVLCPFIDSQIQRISNRGFLGAVIDRTILIKNSYEVFRTKVLLESGRLQSTVDLGWGVLDANVEVSVLICGNKLDNPLVYGGNLSSVADKENELQMRCHSSSFIYRYRGLFLKMPFAAINFDVPNFFFNLLNTAKSLSETLGPFYNGHTIKSDVFKRLFWEVSASQQGVVWERMWNGSEYSPYYVAMQEVVLSNNYAGGLKNHGSTIFRNPDKHMRRGLCFGKRGDYLDVQILPEGYVLTNEGFGGPFENNVRTWFVLGFLNSRIAQYMVNLYCGQHKGVGYVGMIPVPEPPPEEIEQITLCVQDIFKMIREANEIEETDPYFVSPFVHFVSRYPVMNDFDQRYRELLSIYTEKEKRIEEIFYLLSRVGNERQRLEQETKSRPTAPIILNYSESEARSYFPQIILSYCVGNLFGRWDIRLLMDPTLAPKLPDPFDPLPVCPPGTLIGPDALPANPGGIVSEEWLRARRNAIVLPPVGSVKKPTIPDGEYPLRISWGGILVDDPEHSDDIIRRIRGILELIWKDEAHKIEAATYSTLGVSDLRDYFRKPLGFFQDHLKRYSKGSRQAPIYWSLSTASGSYTLWLYYHRLTDQTLFLCIQDFVEPKIKEVGRDIERLQKDLQNGKKSVRSEVEHLMDFRQELIDFRDELLRVAKLPYKPNLNDGVMITACSLWKLFRHNAWSRDLKECWEKLEAGEYDWAHLAYSIWPERVREVCKRDRSIAIAHGLEDLYQGEIPVKKSKGKRKK